ncbi:MAG: DUF819 family protein [Bacteroidetes bacterium]|nr:MAG: DUF819 family protein [Bacteroidota bacterium]
MLSHPLLITGVLALNILLAEWLVMRTRLKHLGTALLVILITAVVANLGIIPAATNAPPLYDGIFQYIAPLSIFYLLLEVNLKNLKAAGMPMLLMFLLGSAGTVAGVWVGMQLINGPERIGSMYAPLGGMFTGTYTGGSVNFNAVALHYEVMKEGRLFAGAVAVDNIITALWMGITILAPKLLQIRFPRNRQLLEQEQVDLTRQDESESINPLHLSILLALGCMTLGISEISAAWFKSMGMGVPAILILTTLALVLAQFPQIRQLRGARLMGLFSVYVFLAVIGAYCELSALGGIGQLAVYLLLFALALVAIHALLLFGAAALFRVDWDIASVASQANIGGSSTALALAKSLNRADLMLPAILVGSLGNGLGTYLGFLMAQWLS